MSNVFFLKEKPVLMKRVVLFLVAIILILTISFSSCYIGYFKTISTLKKVDDFPLYTMTYYADYHFKDFLKKGARNDLELAEFIKSKLPVKRSLRIQKPYCTMFSARDDKGNYLTGRNFDFNYTPALLLFTHPSDGYASVSIVDLDVFGFNRTNLPTSTLKPNNLNLLGVPYFPIDGMNEYGVAIGVMAIPFSMPDNNPQKVTINSTAVMRLVLDYAKNVDEAVSLLEKYNIYFSVNIPVHYLISDSSGKSVVIEFISNKMNIIPKSTDWQVASNFIFSLPGKLGGGQDRYELADITLKNCKGILSENEVMELLHKVSQSNTLWSVVYNNNTGTIKIVMGMKYDNIKEFKFKMK